MVVKQRYHKFYAVTFITISGRLCYTLLHCICCLLVYFQIPFLVSLICYCFCVSRNHCRRISHPHFFRLVACIYFCHFSISVWSILQKILFEVCLYILQISTNISVEIMQLCLYPNCYNTNVLSCKARKPLCFVSDIMFMFSTKIGKFFPHPYIRTSTVSP